MLAKENSELKQNFDARHAVLRSKGFSEEDLQDFYDGKIDMEATKAVIAAEGVDSRRLVRFDE